MTDETSPRTGCSRRADSTTTACWRCALGLDDDPALLAAAEGDAELAGRLAAMRADVARIGAQVGAAVPSPDASYADLSGDRWSGLKEFLEPPATTAKPRRRWWRVVAPVTALAVLALVVGIVAVNGGSGSSSSGSSTEVTSSADGGAACRRPELQGGRRDGGGAGHACAPAGRGARPLRRHRTRQGAPGDAAPCSPSPCSASSRATRPDVVELEVDDRPADTGRLHLLMLDPVATAGDDERLIRADSFSRRYHGASRASPASRWRSPTPTGESRPWCASSTPAPTRTASLCRSPDRMRPPAGRQARV